MVVRDTNGFHTACRVLVGIWLTSLSRALIERFVVLACAHEAYTFDALPGDKARRLKSDPRALADGMTTSKEDA